jgi:hypothetical protein
VDGIFYDRQVAAFGDPYGNGTTRNFAALQSLLQFKPDHGTDLGCLICEDLTGGFHGVTWKSVIQ